MSADDIEIANRIIRPSVIGHIVTRILLDARVTLQFAPAAPGAELRLGHRFRITSSDGTEFDIDPENLGRQAEYAAGLFLAKVTDVNVTDEFVLEVRFADGATLTAPPDDAYESWEYGDDRKALIVCMGRPGGLAIWSPGSRK